MQISIPGSESGIDSNKLIEELLEAEKIPAVRIEEKIKSSQKQRNIWRVTDNNMTLLQDNAKKLYSFNNPFKERSVESSEPYILTADGQRNATLGRYTLYVKSLAKADRWLSKTFTKDYTPPDGKYSITIGEKSVDFSFSGVDVDALIESINKKGKNLVKASVITQGSKKNEIVFLLESLVIGKDGQMTLYKTAEVFGKEISLIGIKEDENMFVEIDTNHIVEYISEESLFKNSLLASNSASSSRATKRASQQFLHIQPGGIAKIKFSLQQYKQIMNTPDAGINFEFIPIPITGTGTVPKPLQNFSTSLENIKINAKNKRDIIAPDAPKETLPEILPEASSQQLSLMFNNNYISIASISDIQDGNPINVSIPISDIQVNNENIAFIIANPLVHHTLVINSVFLNTTQRDTSLVPLRPIDTATDSVVEFNGIDLFRSTNNIDDIIPGVVLHLNKEDEDTVVFVDITSNMESIKNDIIGFVGAYNQVMKELTVYTQDDIEALDTLQFNSEEEREKASENLGIFSDEFSLTRFMTRLQNVAIDQYNNTLDADITSLRAIGIAANLGTNAFNVDASKFLDIEETTLDNMISTNPDALAILFGVDTNNDVAIDYGVAFRIVELLSTYVATNGIITQKQNTLQTNISRDEDRLDDYAEKLVQYEIDLRRKFGNMERSVQALNRASNAVNSFTNNKKDK